MVAIEEDLQLSIHEVEYDHRVGPFRWGRRIGLPIVISGFDFQYYTVLQKWGEDLDIHGGGLYRQKLLAIIDRTDPNTIIVGATLSRSSYQKIREVTGVDINTDLSLNSRFFYIKTK